MNRNDKIAVAVTALGAVVILLFYTKKFKLITSTSDPLSPIGQETDFGFSGVIESGHGTTISHEDMMIKNKNRDLANRKSKNKTIQELL